MSEKTIELITKAGAAAILGLLLYLSMLQNHRERSANDARLHMLMERQTHAIEELVRIYSGK